MAKREPTLEEQILNVIKKVEVLGRYEEDGLTKQHPSVAATVDHLDRALINLRLYAMTIA